jgi:hypothetical protein
MIIHALSIRTCATMFPPSSATAMLMGYPISLAFFSAALITRWASSKLAAVIDSPVLCCAVADNHMDSLFRWMELRFLSGKQLSLFGRGEGEIGAGSELTPGGSTHHGGRPRDTPRLIPQLGCSAMLEELLKEVCATSTANIRGRVMHGGLLEVETQRAEALLNFVKPAPQGFRSSFSPENVCQLCLECLELLD